MDLARYQLPLHDKKSMVLCRAEKIAIEFYLVTG